MRVQVKGWVGGWAGGRHERFDAFRRMLVLHFY